MLKVLAEGMYRGFQNDNHPRQMYSAKGYIGYERKTLSKFALIRQLKTTADSVLEKECVQTP
jgi:hypothetical protein